MQKNMGQCSFEKCPLDYRGGVNKLPKKIIKEYFIYTFLKFNVGFAKPDKKTL